MQKKLQRFIGLIFLFQIFTLSMSAQSWETVKKIGGSNFERSGGIARDNDGNTYLVGEFNGDINIGSVTLTSTNNTNAFLAKLDSNGNTLWAKDFSALGFNLFNLRYGVDVDDSGNGLLDGDDDGQANDLTTEELEQNVSQAQQEELDLINKLGNTNFL